MFAVLKKVVLLPRNSQAEFLEQREQKQTKFDFAESRTRMPTAESRRK